MNKIKNTLIIEEIKNLILDIKYQHIVVFTNQ